MADPLLRLPLPYLPRPNMLIMFRPKAAGGTGLAAVQRIFYFIYR